MKPGDARRIKWELARERFRIAESTPPLPRRREKRIGDVLAVVLNQQPAGHPPDLLTERWPVIAGAQIARHTRPAQIREQVLTVYADHPGWLTEIRRLPKHRILKKMDSVPGLPEIRDIRFVLDPSIRSATRRKAR